MKVFIVIAAYNVAERIITVIHDLQAAGFDNLIVVDDASVDNTYHLALAQGVIVLHHIMNRGQGAALQTGDAYALRHDADYIVHFDGDGQMQAKDIKNMLAPLEQGTVDITLGSRYLGLTSNIPALKRYFYFPVGRIINFLFTGLWLSDVHCGLRAMNRSTAEKIIITQDRMAHNSEILGKISTYHLSFKEIPVTIIYHQFGQGFIGGARIVKDLLKAKLLK